MLIPDRLALIGDHAYHILQNCQEREAERAAWDIIRLVDDVLIPYSELCLRLAVKELEDQEVSSQSGASLRSAPLSSQLYYTK